MKKLIAILTGLISALSLLGTFQPQIQTTLALSYHGLKSYFLWQPFSYVLIEPGPLSLGFLIHLAFNVYMIWLFGSALLDRLRPAQFIFLYFGSALFTALVSLPFLPPFLATTTPPIFAILTAWMMLNQDTKLLLFFSFPIKAAWLILGIAAFALFLAISHDAWIEASTLLAGIFFGYLFALIGQRTMSPFAILRPFEKKVLQLFERRKKSPSPSKIYDIKSGEPVLDDEKFMDAMLDRISRHGEDSLTLKEKKRMQEISAKKKSRFP